MNELIETIKNGNLKKVKYLVEHGANIYDGDNWSLRWASYNGHLNIVRYLVEQGADIHASDNCALRWATESNHFNTVKYLKSIYIEKYKEKFLCFNCVVLPCCTQLCSNQLILKDK